MQRQIFILSIVNLVATAELSQSVVLTRLIHAKGFLYDTAIYRCAYLKDKQTRAKVSIFSSGKMICVGAKSFDVAKRDLNYANRRLAELGLVSRRNLDVKLRNIVASGDIGHPMNIEQLALKLPNFIYEPEQFPGAIYYAKELEGASILIFANGKTVVAGLKDERLLEVAKNVLVKLGQITSD